MCEVMPTISEGDTGGPPRGTGGVPNGSDQEANFEQLMVNMLDERDKLLESLRETQETLIQSQTKLQGALHERDVLQRQINAALPQVRSSRPLEGEGRAVVSAEMDEGLSNGAATFMCMICCTVKCLKWGERKVTVLPLFTRWPWLLHSTVNKKY